jgi:hypothetical protein
MYSFKRFLIFKLVILFSCVLQAQVSFQTKQFKLSFDQSGKLTEMLDRSTNKNYLPQGETAFLLSVRRKGTIINPVVCSGKVNLRRSFFPLLIRPRQQLK